MPAPDIAKTVTTVLPWVTTGVGWIVALLQWRKKRKAEAELKLIRRRGDAPYLMPSSDMFSLLYFGLSLNEVRVCQAGEGALLCYCRDEVAKDTPKGTTIFFVIGNHGQAARRLTLTLDGQPITLEQEPQMDGAHGLTFLQYPYDPARHGLNQTLVIKFESTSGMQDCHTYTLKHGVRHLARMDPP